MLTAVDNFFENPAIYIYIYGMNVTAKRKGERGERWGGGGGAGCESRFKVLYFLFTIVNTKNTISPNRRCRNIKPKRLTGCFLHLNEVESM